MKKPQNKIIKRTNHPAKMKPFGFILLIITLSFICGNQLFGQEKINVSAGFGVPEFLNIAVRYQFKQNQIGVGFGTLPGQNRNFTISGEYFYHFGGSSELSIQRPWYGKISFVYLREESDTKLASDSFLSLRVGRNFNISKKVGIMIDAGAAVTLFHERTKKYPDASNWDLHSPVWPGLGIGLFYRI